MDASTIGGRLSCATALAALVGLSGCASWSVVETRENYTLYAKPGEHVDAARFDQSLTPAFLAVEERFGPFEKRVDIHASDGVESGAPALAGISEGDFDSVPGIGPAKVRAYHVRSGPNPFAQSGVFLGSADTGTAVHELVHARLADEHVELPLWFEEGLASYYGDGALVGERWIVDGLACWPLRELREERLSDADLARLLALSPSDECTARDNLLVHFIGWAIVFDLAREEPDGTWREWLALFGPTDDAVQARRRIARTSDDRTHIDWLERLGDPDPGVRFAAAKGTWKLRSSTGLDLVLDRLAEEQDQEVAVALAINALLTAGEIRLSGRLWGRMGRSVFPTLRRAELPDPAEQEALEELLAAMRGRGGRDSELALAQLSRFWDE